MRKILIVLGVPIDALNMKQALERLIQFVDIGRKTGKTHQIATVNADFAVKALSDPELLGLLQTSDMATADGMPLVWASRFLGLNLPERVAGSDLVPLLATAAAEKGYSMYLLGGAPGIAEQAAAILQEQNPTLKITGTASPPFTSILEMDQCYIDEIKTARPDILLVAMGNPKQEKWIGMYGREVGAPVAIGVGSTLDLIAGHTKRAPLWMQNIGAEWLYRLAQEPRRLWRRYLHDLVGFSHFFFRQWWIMRQGSAPSPIMPEADLLLVDKRALIHLAGRLDLNNYEQILSLGQEALEETNCLEVDLSEVSFLDSVAIGALVLIAKHAREKGGDVRLKETPPRILNTFKLLKLHQLFIIEGGAGKLLGRENHDPPRSPGPNWDIIQLPARFDATTADDILARCQQKLAHKPNLILDFGETRFLASAGLSVMAQFLRDAREQNGEIRLTNCSADIDRVMKMVRFDKLFKKLDPDSYPLRFQPNSEKTAAD